MSTYVVELWRCLHIQFTEHCGWSTYSFDKPECPRHGPGEVRNEGAYDLGGEA